MKNRCSFTMIELLIVVTFIIFFSGFTVAYYNQYTERTKLENAVKKTITALTLVRQRTLSGDSSSCGPLPAITPAVSYFALEIPNPTTYIIKPICKTGSPVNGNYYTEPNISFITPAPIAPLPVVTFFPVSGDTICNYIYIKNKILSASEQCRYIKILQTGAFTDGKCDPDCASCPTTCP